MTAKKPVAVFDIDGTIFRSSLLIEVTRALIELGTFPAIAEEEFAAQYSSWLNREGSYNDYIEGVVTSFKKYIIGRHPHELEAAADLVIERTAKRTYRYTRDLIKQLKGTHFLIAISGSPTELVERFAKFYGFSAWHATKYPVEAGRYTGVSFRGDLKKDETLGSIVKQHGLDLKGSLAIGDSEGDIPLLSLAERPIAFNPNSTLFQTAVQNDWQIVVERKDVIYYYHGSRISKAG